MFNILVANSDKKQLESFCQYLANTNSKFNINYAKTGSEAINLYNEISPSVFIMDTNFQDLTSYEIITKLSSTKKESRNCNIILTTDLNEPIKTVSNAEKIYKILFKPVNLIELEKAVNNIYLTSQIPELDELQLQLFLLDLKFNTNSISTKHLIEAIHQCYYFPYLLGNLDDIIKLVAFKFNVSEKTVKSSFRNALKPINNYRNSITQYSFINLFDKMRNITPKYFLEVITTYLHKTNKKEI